MNDISDQEKADQFRFLDYWQKGDAERRTFDISREGKAYAASAKEEISEGVWRAWIVMDLSPSNAIAKLGQIVTRDVGV